MLVVYSEVGLNLHVFEGASELLDFSDELGVDILGCCFVEGVLIDQPLEQVEHIFDVVFLGRKQLLHCRKLVESGILELEPIGI